MRWGQQILGTVMVAALGGAGFYFGTQAMNTGTDGLPC